MAIILPGRKNTYPVPLVEYEDGLVPIGKIDGCIAAVYDVLPHSTQNGMSFSQIGEMVNRICPAVVYLSPFQLPVLKQIMGHPELGTLPELELHQKYGALQSLVVGNYAEVLQDQQVSYRKTFDGSGISVIVPRQIQEAQIAVFGMGFHIK